MPVFIGIILLVVVADQLSKYWIVTNFTLHQSVPVVEGFFDLTYLHNTGAAFGMLAGQPGALRQIFFISVALIALVVLVLFQRKFAGCSPYYNVVFGLIGGGAVGNLIDRIRYGSVVDFLDFYLGVHHYPAFNVADSAITVGVGIFFLLSVQQDRNNKTNSSPTTGHGS